MPETGTRTVERALTLLAAVAEEGGTLTQLARAAELSPSTASRLLATLAGQELVRRDEYGRYGPGTRLRQLAAVALRSDPVYELAGPHLLEPRSLALGAAVGLLSTAIPYSFEVEALRRIRPSVFGVLMSIEPAMAALAGFIVLGQSLSARTLLGMALVVVASVGAARRTREAPIAV